jgi:hypothetical protein
VDSERKERGMNSRIARTMAALGVTAAVAFGGTGVAQASHGDDDDGARHHRHARADDHRGHRDDGPNHR